MSKPERKCRASAAVTIILSMRSLSIRGDDGWPPAARTAASTSGGWAEIGTGRTRGDAGSQDQSLRTPTHNNCRTLDAEGFSHHGEATTLESPYPHLLH